jgi:AmmeMemoRadiSam system protein B
MRVNSTRPAAVAGTWYPGSPGALARDVDEYLAAVGSGAPIPRGRLDAVIAPHAGLMFSGPVGAYAYKAAADHGPFDAIILVGPSHFVAFDGVALYPSGAFESPLGPAPIDEQLGRQLMAASSLIQPLPAAHAREHSLEMQLPFIRRLLPDAAIVPLLMGYQTRETIQGLAEALAKVAAEHAAYADKKILLVASTDLSHYFDAPTAEALDRRVVECVAACDPERFLQIFEEYPEGERGRFVACGGGPAIAVMLAARARGARHGRVLHYMHSGQISGDNSGVVGYLAGALGTFSEGASAREPRERSGEVGAPASERVGGLRGAKPPVKNDVH